MPYENKPGARKYGDNPMKPAAPKFTLRSGNGPLPFKQMGSSPLEKDKVEFTHGKKEEDKHFLTKQPSIPEVEHSKGTYFSKNQKEANAKKLKELETKFKAGEITQTAFEEAKAEIPGYTNY